MNLGFLKKKKSILTLITSIILVILILAIMSPAISCKIIDIKNNIMPGEEAENLVDKRRLLVGTDASYPPFEYLNKEGNIEGFDIDIIKEVAASIEKEIEIKNISYDCLYADLKEKRIDLIISAIPSKGESNEEIVYSDTYYVLEYVLLALSDTEAKLKEELHNKNIGILKTDNQNIGEDILSNYRIENYEDIKIMSEDLRNKKIDGAIVSMPIAVNLLGEIEKPFKAVEVFNSKKEFVIALRQDSGILENINGAIEGMHKSSSFKEIYSNWFSFN